MKRKWRSLLFVVLIAFSIYLPGLLLTPAFLEKHGLVFGKNAVFSEIQQQPKETIDILIAGDSLSYTSVSPASLWRNYGFTSYDIGQPGATLTDALDVLLTSFENQKPQIVLLETNTLFHHQSLYDQQQSRISLVLYRAMPFLRYHNGWKAFFLGKKKRTYKGFPVNTKRAAYRGGNYMKRTEDKAWIDEANLTSLREIRELCENRGAVLVLYSAPSPLCYTYAKHNALSQVGEEEGIPYIDLNLEAEEIGLDWAQDTRDRGDHLNDYGAEKVSVYLGSYLKTEYSPTDHRGDPDISRDWE